MGVVSKALVLLLLIDCILLLSLCVGVGSKALVLLLFIHCLY